MSLTVDHPRDRRLRPGAGARPQRLGHPRHQRDHAAELCDRGVTDPHGHPVAQRFDQPDRHGQPIEQHPAVTLGVGERRQRNGGKGGGNGSGNGSGGNGGGDRGRRRWRR